jgi:hypothetical protein
VPPTRQPEEPLPFRNPRFGPFTPRRIQQIVQEYRQRAAIPQAFVAEPPPR